jgi:hypothetical protein
MCDDAIEDGRGECCLSVQVPSCAARRTEGCSREVRIRSLVIQELRPAQIEEHLPSDEIEGGTDDVANVGTKDPNESVPPVEECARSISRDLAHTQAIG